MRLAWKNWTYDLVKNLIRSIGVSGSAWLGLEIKYRELNLADLGYCLLFGAVARTLFHFLENEPLPRDLDAPPPSQPPTTP